MKTNLSLLLALLALTSFTSTALGALDADTLALRQAIAKQSLASQSNMMACNSCVKSHYIPAFNGKGLVLVKP